MSRSNALLLWYGVLGAPLAWTLQLVAGYWLEEAVCGPGARSWDVDGDLWEAVASAGALLLALAAVAAAAAGRRRLGHEVDPSGRLAFLVAVALLGGALFLSLIVLTGAGVIALDSCESG